MTTVRQDNSDRFASRRDDTGTQIDAERTRGIQLAIGLITRGKPGRAFYELQRSLRRQLLLTGIGELQLGPEATPHGVGSSSDLLWPPLQGRVGVLS